MLDRAKLTVRLLLESALALHGQFGSHLVDMSLTRCAGLVVQTVVVEVEIRGPEF